MISARLLILAAVLLPPALIIIYLNPPQESGLYPPCVFYTLTGLYCPGCGAARCLHALLHGDLAQAAAYNVFLLAAIPCLAGWFAFRIAEMVRPDRFPPLRLPAWLILTVFWLIVGFWILRNLPWHPFNVLAPHEVQVTENG